MRSADRVIVDPMLLELALHRAGALNAHANEAGTALRQALDGRDADILGEAFRDDLTFVEVDEQDAAHSFSSRFAAAMASLRLL
jgi:hypothetical protein